MEINLTEYHQAAVLEIDGRLDSEGATSLETVLQDLYDQHRPIIVLNMEMVDYVNSSGLRVLARFLKISGDCNCTLRLLGVTPNVHKALDLVGLSEFFPRYENLEAALT